MAAAGRLVKWRRVRMATDRVVSVWIFTHVKQHSNDLDMTKICCQSKSQMTVLSAGAREQLLGVLDAPQSCRCGQIDSSAAPDQGIHRFELTEQGRCVQSAVGIRSVIAKEIDERKLHATFARYAPSRNKHERFVHCGLARASIQNDFRDRNDILRQSATADGILGYKFEQRWIVKVVPTLENDVLVYEIRMLR